MTRSEFLRVTTYLAVGSGKALSADSLEVYFDCLADLPFDVFALAAKRVLMEHRFATFPSIAELREAAAATQQGQVQEMTAAEAWAIAWGVAANTDPEVAGSFARASANCPAVVLEAIRCFGLTALCYGTEPVGVVRGQFMKMFEQLAGRRKRVALLPPALTKEIEATGRRGPELLGNMLAGIGNPN